MELVYLWVEKYKNIEKQGFNFSSRFTEECSLRKNILNLFPNRINITAIIGKNGSGKSNILESLISIVYENGIPIDPPTEHKMSAIFYDDISKCFFTKDINYSICIPKTVLESRRNSELSRECKTFILHYNYSLEYITNEKSNIPFAKFYHKIDDYHTPILLQPDKSNYQINLNRMDYLANQDILNFTIKKENSFKNIEDFFEIKSCKLYFTYSNIHGKKRDEEDDTPIYDFMRQLLYKQKLNIFENMPSYGIDDFSSSLELITKDGLILLTKLYILKKSIKIEPKTIKHELFKQAIKDKKFDEAMKMIDNGSFEELYVIEHQYKTYKLEQSFLFLDFIKSQEPSCKLSNEHIDIKDNKDLLLNLPPWINIEFFNENNVSLYDLSYGQKFLIRFLYSLLNQLKNLETHTKYEDIILLLDEVEMGLHPQ